MEESLKEFSILLDEHNDYAPYSSVISEKNQNYVLSSLVCHNQNNWTSSGFDKESSNELGFGIFTIQIACLQVFFLLFIIDNEQSRL